MLNCKQTIRDAWDLEDIPLEEYRHYLILTRYQHAMDFPQRCIWCMDYCPYPFWIILATIFFNIAFITLLHQETKEICKWFKYIHWHPETVTLLSCQVISIKHGVNVIHYFSHLIRANETRNKQFINTPKKLKALYEITDYWILAISWNWIPMVFSVICDILQKCNENIG